MTVNIPNEVLSDNFVQRIKGRRILAALFATYQFDAGFFEQEVLAALLDVALSHAKPIRLLQLEEALRSVPGGVAVYYDANGIEPGASGGPKLDVKRIPVRHKTGVFHPKNVFLLLEEEGADGRHVRALLVASMSANLTRSGWWENVEVCHIEEIVEGSKTRLKCDLIAFLERTESKARSESEHSTLRLVRDFLRGTEQGTQRTANDTLHTHFYSGRERLADFLSGVAEQRLRGSYLEVISPYFDDSSECGPLRELIERFEPKEVRVFLPRDEKGTAACREDLYENVLGLPNTSWGRLPKELLRLGSASDAGERFVHAKVYRFFTMNPKRETYFVGSANLTNAAHGSGGNVETGFLVETIPERRPEFWLMTDTQTPLTFQTKSEAGDTDATLGSRLSIRYHWDTGIASAFWDAPSESPILQLEGRGVALGSTGVLAPREWTDLEASFANAIRDMLSEQAMLFVRGDGETPGVLLVQEEGFSHKPSLILQLSAADILRYWALLTSAQRAAFLETRAPEAALTGEGADLVARAEKLTTSDTIFDRFAGFFHAFGCLERSVRAALDDDNPRDAIYRLFGKKHDSLGCLLDRVLAKDSGGDAVDNYVIALCAEQLCREVERDYPDFWRERRDDANELKARFKEARGLRDALVASDPETMPNFLEWFERRFLARSRSAQVDK